MAFGNLLADFVQPQLVIDFLQKEVTAVKELLFPFLKEFRRRIADKDFLVFIVFFAV